MSGDTDRGPNSLKNVYTALFKVADQWFNLGLQLDVDSNDLKKISSEKNLQKNEEKLREMLTVRLAQGDLTWDQITEALENPTIGQQVIADEIRSKYIITQATTTTPVKRAKSTPVMSPVTSTLNTATGLTTGTHTTVTTASINRRLSMQPTTAMATNTPQASSTNTPQASRTNNSNTPEASGTQERGHSSTAPVGKKRPASDTTPEGSKRSKTADYYDEKIFANKNILTKYRCIHCNKIPKSCFRCNCGKTDKQEVGRGRARVKDNTGLSCSDCKINPCTNCKQSDQYEPDKVTNGNIGKLMVVCENKCGENVPLYKRESHLKNECSKQKRPCKYVWAGCTHEGAGDEIEQHEKEVETHVLAAIDKLHEKNLESNSDLRKDDSDLRKDNSDLKKDNSYLKNDNSDLKKDNSDLRKDNSDLKKRVELIEAKLNAMSTALQP